VFDVPSDLVQTLLTRWTGNADEALDTPSELPELLQNQRNAGSARGGGTRGWRNGFQGGGGGPRRSWAPPRDFNRNGMPKRRTGGCWTLAQNSRKSF